MICRKVAPFGGNMECNFDIPRCEEGREFMGTADITDCIEAFAVVYEDGEQAGVYQTERQAERAHIGEEYKIVRLVPAEEVIIKQGVANGS